MDLANFEKMFEVIMIEILSCMADTIIMSITDRARQPLCSSFMRMSIFMQSNSIKGRKVHLILILKGSFSK